VRRKQKQPAYLPGARLTVRALRSQLKGVSPDAEVVLGSLYYADTSRISARYVYSEDTPCGRTVLVLDPVQHDFTYFGG